MIQQTEFTLRPRTRGFHLVTDEITANLDAQTEARVLEALRRASAGRTVISISHRIYEQLGGRMIEIRALDGETGEGKDLNSA